MVATVLDVDADEGANKREGETELGLRQGFGRAYICRGSRWMDGTWPTRAWPRDG